LMLLYRSESSIACLPLVIRDRQDTLQFMPEVPAKDA
jgi:hypothetical protein